MSEGHNGPIDVKRINYVNACVEGMRGLRTIDGGSVSSYLHSAWNAGFQEGNKIASESHDVTCALYDSEIADLKAVIVRLKHDVDNEKAAGNRSRTANAHLIEENQKLLRDREGDQTSRLVKTVADYEAERENTRHNWATREKYVESLKTELEAANRGIAALVDQNRKLVDIAHLLSVSPSSPEASSR